MLVWLCFLQQCQSFSQPTELNPLTAEWALRALPDFTLSNARRFYSSMGNSLAGRGIIIIWVKYTELPVSGLDLREPQQFVRRSLGQIFPTNQNMTTRIAQKKPSQQAVFDCMWVLCWVEIKYTPYFTLKYLQRVIHCLSFQNICTFNKINQFLSLYWRWTLLWSIEFYPTTKKLLNFQLIPDRF